MSLVLWLSSSRLVLLSATLVLLLGPTVVDSRTYTTYLFDGARTDPLLVNCTFAWSRDVTLKFGPTHGDFRRGTKLTGYEAINLQSFDKAVIARVSGGLGKDEIWFHMKEVNDNEVYYRFQMWGIVPAGQSATFNSGTC